MKIKIIQTKVKPEEAEIISKASGSIGVPRSSFLRMVGLREARKILVEFRKNNEEGVNKNE